MIKSLVDNENPGFVPGYIYAAIAKMIGEIRLDIRRLNGLDGVYMGYPYGIYTVCKHLLSVY